MQFYVKNLVAKLVMKFGMDIVKAIRTSEFCGVDFISSIPYPAEQ